MQKETEKFVKWIMEGAFPGNHDTGWILMIFAPATIKVSFSTSSK